MADLKDDKLNKELERLKKQVLPSMEDIEQENKKLEKREGSFLKKFFKRKKNKK